MVLQAGGEPCCGIGTRLRAGRERKGFTVLQAAEKMHVDARILESLEAEDFDALGAPVFVRGHLRHYAELVGEQPAELQSLYANSARVTQPDLTRIPKAVPSSDPRKLTIPAIVVLLGFAIVGVVWWVVKLPKVHPPVDRAQTALAPQPPQSRAQDSATDAAQPQGVTQVESAPRKPAVAAPRAPTTSVSGGQSRASTASPASGAPRGSAADAAPGSSAPTAASRAPKQAELTLRFSAESWAEVYDSAGDRLFYDIGPAASVRTFKGSPPLRIVLGNAPGVAVEVNGHTTDLASLTHPDGSAQFVVNRAGRATGSP